jgi:hypothetical protein
MMLQYYQLVDCGYRSPRSCWITQSPGSPSNKDS